ncbi:MAG: hypothetical protein M3O87_03370 [Candidatus Dormibacteraeota bacterium]|nr:hypothetical protein [Candidatus Dormibacteraeota bacterium]
MLAGSITAHAATVNCAGLQTALNGGGTVILSDAALCTGTFTLTVPVLLEGANSNQGFDGSSHGGTRSLSGTDVGAVTVVNLTFQNSSSGSSLGGALMLTGDIQPQVLNNRFFANTSDSGGGAASIVKNVNGGPFVISGNTFGASAFGAGNRVTTGSGGALFASARDGVTISNNTFIENSSTVTGNNTNAGAGGMFFQYFGTVNGAVATVSGNTFSNNTSHLNGGGAVIVVDAAQGMAPDIHVSANVFSNNRLLDTQTDFVTHQGGGLFIQRDAPGTTVQSHNKFDGNDVTAPTVSEDQTYDYGGGGEWLAGGNTTSLDDTYINNVVSAVSGSSVTGVGGGLAVRGLSQTNGATLTATNLVSGGNTVGADGEGAGIYAGGVGCSSAVCPATLNLNDSTVVANTSGGTGGGIAGDATDTLHLANDIVTNNSGRGPAIAGFGTTTVTYTDACNGTSAYSGTGNICADPKLVSVTPGAINVHETATSPTIDKGLNSLVTPGTPQDYAGNTRILGAAVDMGAAEFTPLIPSLPAAGSGPAQRGGPQPAWILVALTALLAAVAVAAIRRRTETE